MPRDVGDRPLLLWEEVGRGGRGQCKVENQEDRSYYPKVWTVVRSWEPFGSWCLLPLELRMSLSSLIPKWSAAMNMLPPSLHQKTSDLYSVFYATVKCSHFEIKKGVSMANLKFKFPWWKR